ncbi:MAG TPA: pyruvate kinase alpha/beta domain-containing protein, partial [Azonexus sp.]|nr:pyruvate kinase alpha/beta domain-containing protein [Azonexus sp.]
VAMLAGIAAEVEPHRSQETARKLFEGIEVKGKLKPSGLIAVAVTAATRLTSPAAVFVPTHTGATARSLSLFRLPVWIAAVTTTEQACSNLMFSYGVQPVCEPAHPENWDVFVRNWLAKHQCTEGDVAIVTEGPSTSHPEAHNRMEIIELKRQVHSGDAKGGGEGEQGIL